MNFLRTVLLIAVVAVFAGNNTLTIEASAISPVEALTPQDELRQAIITGNIKIICMKRNTSSETSITKIHKYVDQIFSKLEEQLNDEVWTLVVFSEHFWGNADNILNSSEVTQIVNKCNETTRRHVKTIIHINFLHQFRKSTINDENCGWLNKGIIVASNGRVCSGQREPLFVLASDGVDFRIANYSLIIWNYRPIAIYRKSTYHDEANAFVLPSLEDKHAYEFGDFLTHSLIEDTSNHSGIASLFSSQSPLIITRICADMNERFLSNIPNVKHSMLIVPANFKRISDDLKDKIPECSVIVICDTALGVSLLDAGMPHCVTPHLSFQIDPPCFWGYCQMMNSMSELKEDFLPLPAAIAVPFGKTEEDDDVDEVEESEEESCCCSLFCRCCRKEDE